MGFKIPSLILGCKPFISQTNEKKGKQRMSNLTFIFLPGLLLNCQVYETYIFLPAFN